MLAKLLLLLIFRVVDSWEILGYPNGKQKTQTEILGDPKMKNPQFDSVPNRQPLFTLLQVKRLKKYSDIKNLEKITDKKQTEKFFRTYSHFKCVDLFHVQVKIQQHQYNKPFVQYQKVVPSPSFGNLHL